MIRCYICTDCGTITTTKSTTECDPLPSRLTCSCYICQRVTIAVCAWQFQLKNFPVRWEFVGGYQGLETPRAESVL